MYEQWSERHRWKTEVLSSQPSDMGGFRDVTFVVRGKDAWSHLKHEAGPHRVQRVPVTESQGRVHTSAATVAVLPEAEEVDVDGRPQRPRHRHVPLHRSRRSVGEHDRLRDPDHAPADRSRRHLPGREEPAPEQGQGDADPARRGCSQVEQERQAAELADTRRSQVGGGGRSEKIRTYNYKENRVTDHRIGLTLHNLDARARR